MALWVNAYGKFFWPVQVGGVPPLTEGGGLDNCRIKPDPEQKYQATI